MRNGAEYVSISFAPCPIMPLAPPSTINCVIVSPMLNNVDIGSEREYNLLKPKVQWNIVLRRFMTDLSKGDYSWRKPRKRLLSHGLYMPSLSNPSLAKITSTPHRWFID